MAEKGPKMARKGPKWPSAKHGLSLGQKRLKNEFFTILTPKNRKITEFFRRPNLKGYLNPLNQPLTPHFDCFMAHLRPSDPIGPRRTRIWVKKSNFWREKIFHPKMFRNHPPTLRNRFWAKITRFGGCRAPFWVQNRPFWLGKPNKTPHFEA